MKRIIIITLLLLLPVGFCAADSPDGTTKALNHMGFVSNDPLTITFENGIVVSIANPIFQWRLGADVLTGYYSARTGGVISSKVPIEFSGINLVFRNSSNDLRIIKWAESNISIGGFSCLPFLEGVKWANAGNPSALPDTIIPPGQAIQKTVYLSRVIFTGREWQIIGERIPKDNNYRVSLYIKIADSKGSGNYFTVNTPTLGMR